MTEVIWTNRSINDVVISALYIAKESISAADKFIDKIFSSERIFLGEVNFEGRKHFSKNRADLDYRYYIEGNYKIIYYRKMEKVFIVTVFETRQDPDKLNL